MPDYLSRFRGVRDVGAWLERWRELNLTAGDQVYCWAFILGAAALPYAQNLTSRLQRLAVLRSRYQEGVPGLLRRRFTAFGAALIAGQAVADLGEPPFWPPGFAPPCPMLTLVETRPTTVARRLGVWELTDADLGIAGATEVAIDHDLAYYDSGLIETVVAWLRDDLRQLQG